MSCAKSYQNPIAIVYHVNRKRKCMLSNTWNIGRIENIHFKANTILRNVVDCNDSSMLKWWSKNIAFLELSCHVGTQWQWHGYDKQNSKKRIYRRPVPIRCLAQQSFMKEVFVLHSILHGLSTVGISYYLMNHKSRLSKLEQHLYY